MTIPEFLNNVQTNLKVKIIDKLDNTFNSHDFLEKFAEVFERKYIDFLNYYKGKCAFQAVHSQIGKYLRKHENDLKIKGIGKIDSKNVFGNFDGFEKWKIEIWYVGTRIVLKGKVVWKKCFPTQN